MDKRQAPRELRGREKGENQPREESGREKEEPQGRGRGDKEKKHLEGDRDRNTSQARSSTHAHRGGKGPLGEVWEWECDRGKEGMRNDLTHTHRCPPHI